MQSVRPALSGGAGDLRGPNTGSGAAARTTDRQTDRQVVEGAYRNDCNTTVRALAVPEGRAETWMAAD